MEDLCTWENAEHALSWPRKIQANIERRARPVCMVSSKSGDFIIYYTLYCSLDIAIHFIYSWPSCTHLFMYSNKINNNNNNTVSVWIKKKTKHPWRICVRSEYTPCTRRFVCPFRGGDNVFKQRIYTNFCDNSAVFHTRRQRPRISSIRNALYRYAP